MKEPPKLNSGEAIAFGERFSGCITPSTMISFINFTPPPHAKDRHPQVEALWWACNNLMHAFRIQMHLGQSENGHAGSHNCGICKMVDEAKSALSAISIPDKLPENTIL